MKNQRQQNKNNPGISVFFPCYNDEHTIGQLVKDAISAVATITHDWEVIVVDDGSTDTSNEVVRRITRRNTRVHLVTHEKNLGYGAALQSGFHKASKELVFYTDGDGQYDPRELLLLLPLMTRDTDFVNGIKLVRKDPTYRVIVGNFYNFFVRWLFWLPVQDVDCDFRLIRKKILRGISLTARSGAICVELVKKSQLAGARFREVSVHHYDREYGVSQFFQPRRIITTFMDLVCLWIQLIFRQRMAEHNSYAKE